MSVVRRADEPSNRPLRKIQAGHPVQAYAEPITGSLYYATKRDDDGNPYWALTGDDCRTAAWSGESFGSVDDAQRALERFKTIAASAVYETFTDEWGFWRWRALRLHHCVAASAEVFDSKANAVRSAAHVRDNAGGAAGP